MSTAADYRVILAPTGAKGLSDPGKSMSDISDLFLHVTLRYIAAEAEEVEQIAKRLSTWATVLLWNG